MLTTVVRGTVAQSVEETEVRFATLQDLLGALPDHLSVVALPAGYFRVPNLTELQVLANRLAALPKLKEIALLVGVDLRPKDEPKNASGKSFKSEATHSQKTAAKEKKGDKSDKPKGKKNKAQVPGEMPNYPFYGIACLPDANEPRIFHQTSVTGSERGLGNIENEGRFFNMGGLKIGVLLCGEIFNHDIRNLVVTEKPSLVVDLAHDAGGIGGRIGAFRAFAGMKILARAGITSVLSAHARTANSFQGWAPHHSEPVKLTNIEVHFQEGIIKGHHWPLSQL